MWPTVATLGGGVFISLATYCGYCEWNERKQHRLQCQRDAERECQLAMRYRREAITHDPKSLEYRTNMYWAEVALGNVIFWNLKESEGPYGWKQDCASQKQRELMEAKIREYWSKPPPKA